MIRPFAGLRPVPECAQDVVAPPYDVLTASEARREATGRPLSFLHISKAEIDLPEGTDAYSDAVYAKARENFLRLRKDGVLRQDLRPSYYLYQLTMGSHVQNGLVVAASVEAYQQSRIRRHEFTRPDKEDDRVRQIDALDAQTGPVFLTYRERPQISAMLAQIRMRPSETDVRLSGVRHRLWLIDEPEITARLTAEFERVDALYIADGHHRSAAAARVAGLRRERNRTHRGDESYDYFLAVVFPDTEMQILDYNRVVQDLNHQRPDEFLARLRTNFEITPVRTPVKPSRKGEFGMYLGGAWYRLCLVSGRVGPDPVASLDVSLLDQYILAPVLGISDPRRDRRIDFVGGIRGLEALEQRVDNGMAVAFSLFPTALSDLMTVADTGGVMPPKSTWFEPKLADGLVSLLTA